MSGSPNERLRDPIRVRQLRDSNKTFGLENGEEWSHQKLLLDFLDQMFNDSIPAIAKLDKPVSDHYQRDPPSLPTQASVCHTRASLQYPGPVLGACTARMFRALASGGY